MSQHLYRSARLAIVITSAAALAIFIVFPTRFAPLKISLSLFRITYFLHFYFLFHFCCHLNSNRLTAAADQQTGLSLTSFLPHYLSKLRALTVCTNYRHVWSSTEIFTLANMEFIIFVFQHYAMATLSLSGSRSSFAQFFFDNYMRQQCRQLCTCTAVLTGVAVGVMLSALLHSRRGGICTSLTSTDTEIDFMNERFKMHCPSARTDYNQNS